MAEFRVQLGDHPDRWMAEDGTETTLIEKAAVFAFRDEETGIDAVKITERTREIAGLFGDGKTHPFLVWADRQKALRKHRELLQAGIQHYAKLLALADNAVGGDGTIPETYINRVSDNVDEFDDPWEAPSAKGGIVRHPGLATLQEIVASLWTDVARWQTWARWEVLAVRVPEAWKTPATCPYWGWRGEYVLTAWTKATALARQGKSMPSDS